MPTEYNKIFIDTAPFIYYLEQNPLYFEKTKSIFEKCLKTHTPMITSVITIQEYLIYPYMHNDNHLVKNFYSFLTICNIGIIDITRPIAEKAAKIRAELQSIKGMDALQLACAVTSHCSTFLTNDIHLCRYNKLSCVTPNTWQ